jgi:hypothetical protein
MQSLMIQRRITRSACHNCLGAFAKKATAAASDRLTPHPRAMLSSHGIWYARMEIVKAAHNARI